MKTPKWIVGLVVTGLTLAACSSSPAKFNQGAALRGVDTILAAFKADSSGQGPTLLQCPFGELPTIGAALAKAGGLTLGKLGKPDSQITSWGNATDGGRAINCAVTATGFAFSIGVQRGRHDEHPPASGAWQGPSSFGGGKLYFATVNKICSAAWARPGTYFTVGVQIVQASLSQSKCEAAGRAGVTIVVKALQATEPFNVVPSSSGPAATASTSP